MGADSVFMEVGQLRAFGGAGWSRADTPLARLVDGSAVLLLGVIPLIFLGAFLYTAASADAVAVDLQHAFLGAAHDVVHGRSPYPAASSPTLRTGTAYVYPPLVAFLSTPLLLVPAPVAAWAGTLAMLLMLWGALWVLGVRDWRCYGVVLFWKPTLTAIQNANVSIPLLLAAAVAWSRRDRLSGALGVGAAVAAKVILWPLAVWFVATRRSRQAVVTAVSAAALVVVPWAILGFAGVRGYWRLTRTVAGLEGPRSYTLGGLCARLDVPHPTAAAAALGLAVLGVSVVLAFRGDETRSFSVALLAALLLSPVLWVHYLVLLAVPIALRERRFGSAWLLPLLLWFGFDSVGNGIGTNLAAWQIALPLVVATVGFAFSPGEPDREEGAWAAPSRFLPFSSRCRER